MTCIINMAIICIDIFLSFYLQVTFEEIVSLLGMSIQKHYFIFLVAVR
jgi:hypothetical protein